MSDALLAAGWLLILAGGIGGCIVLHRLGLKTTYVRDMLHVGAGVWVLGWPWWTSRPWPIAIVMAACAATFLMPVLARRSHAIARARTSFAGGDERWLGLSLYTASFAVFTLVGLRGAPFPAAAALLSLCLGDGLGGAFGRRFGHHFFHVPGGKTKSVEGSLVVALGALAAAFVAARWFDVSPPFLLVLGIGVGASVVEALSPRGTDNVSVPAVVWLLARGGLGVG